MSVGADLLRFSDRPIIVFDKETQRVNTLMDNLPFQLSFAVTRRGKIIERHNHYLKWPGFKMSADAARITRFQQSWVDNGEDPRKVLAKWESYALSPDYLISGHNALTFDLPVWQLWRRELGLKPDWSPIYRMLDTHLLSRAYLLGFKPDRDNLTAWFYKVSAAYEGSPKTNLTAMCKELKIPIDETRTHDGFYDVELTAALLWKLINVMEI